MLSRDGVCPELQISVETVRRIAPERLLAKGRAYFGPFIIEFNPSPMLCQRRMEAAQARVWCFFEFYSKVSVLALSQNWPEEATISELTGAGLVESRSGEQAKPMGMPHS